MKTSTFDLLTGFRIDHKKAVGDSSNDQSGFVLLRDFADRYSTIPRYSVTRSPRNGGHDLGGRPVQDDQILVAHYLKVENYPKRIEE